MCGIAGIIRYDKKVNVQDLKVMTDKLSHRGPDGEGQWVNPSGAVGFGHRRLSIIDLSDGGSQPMHYDQGRFTITLNGEIYNYVELKRELQKKGYKFSSDSDTEVLLALYQDMGAACLQVIDGMFAFAIWDEKEHRLFCARDRFGEKPFFIAQTNEGIFFASEIKAILAAGVDKEIRYDRIYTYFVYNALYDTHNPETSFYKNVNQLRPSHYFTLDLLSKKIKFVKYYDIDLSVKTDLSENEIYEKFDFLMRESMSRRLRSDVAVGTSLSGGLDSSTIVSLIESIKKKGNRQKTFSGRFENFELDEGKYMQMMIDSCAVEPHFVWLTVDHFVNDLERAVYHQDEPFGSTSILASLNVYRLAKEENVTVLLDGQGADELMGGYWVYYISYLKELFVNDRQKYLKERSAFNEIHNSDFIDNYKGFRFEAYFPNLRNDLGDLKRNFIPGIVPVLKELNYDFVNSYKGGKSPHKKFSTLNKTLKYSTTEWGLEEILRCVDRNSMSHSREVRLPFLYHKLVEFIFSIPSDLKIRDGWTKYILRKSMETTLPQEIIWRKDKVAYSPPQKRWMKDKRIVEMIEESKNHLRSENILSEKTPNNMITDWQILTVSKFLKSS